MSEVLPPVYRFFFTVYEPLANLVGGLTLSLCGRWFFTHSSAHGPVPLSMLEGSTTLGNGIDIMTSHLGATAIAFAVLEHWSFWRMFELVKGDPVKEERLVDSFQKALVLIDVLYITGSLSPILGWSGSTGKEQTLQPGIVWFAMLFGVALLLTPRLFWLARVGRYSPSRDGKGQAGKEQASADVQENKKQE